jgi:predicted nucleotidyltransferase
MTEYALGHDRILAALKGALEPLEYTHAMWEGGAAAFGRADEWSDIDLQVDVDDDRVEEALALIERTIEALSPIELRYRLPEPTWHGHAQVFYRLRDASPYLLLDLVVLRHSNDVKFLEPEIHGPAVFYFDKAGLAQAPAFDAIAWQARLRERLAALRATFDLFQVLTLKELNRGNWLEALAYYQGYTLRPLLEVLNMRYRPTRYNFGSRYVYYELPAEVARRLESLYFVASGAAIAAKRAEAEAWFRQTCEDLAAGNLPERGA